MSVDNLWWTSNGAVHALLQDHGLSNTDQVKKQLESHYEWLLSGLTSFQQPNDASRKLVSDSRTVAFKGKKFAIEPLLRPATLKLSLLLVRTHVWRMQTHVTMRQPCTWQRVAPLRKHSAWPCHDHILFQRSRCCSRWHRHRMRLA